MSGPLIVRQSREDPARVILVVIAWMTLCAQFFTLITTVPWWLGVPNFTIVLPFCLWGLISAYKGNLKHEARSSFFLGLMWSWSGITRLIIVDGRGQLLWVPFLVIGAVSGVLYLHFSLKRRVGGDE